MHSTKTPGQGFAERVTVHEVRRDRDRAHAIVAIQLARARHVFELRQVRQRNQVGAALRAHENVREIGVRCALLRLGQ